MTTPMVKRLTNPAGVRVSLPHLPEKLLFGYRDFMTGRYSKETVRYRTLARDGQSPRTMIIACCDSRAAPETVFGAGPGELFVLRNLGNLVPSYSPDGEYNSTPAALEFAVQSLKVKNIVVMGHGRCGGIRALADAVSAPQPAADPVRKWMGLVTSALETVSTLAPMTALERLTALERISIRNSIANLRTFPCVGILEDRGHLSLFGAWFDVSSGELWVLNRSSGEFERPDIK